MEGSYKFVHDRVQEAAYLLIPEALRDEAHLRIGRQLAAHIPPEEREEAIFDIVNQFNRGARLDHFARRARAGGRAQSACGQARKGLYCIRLGAEVSGRRCGTVAGRFWERRHELIFALELHRAECEFLTGALGSRRGAVEFGGF